MLLSNIKTNDHNLIQQNVLEVPWRSNFGGDTGSQLCSTHVSNSLTDSLTTLLNIEWIDLNMQTMKTMQNMQDVQNMQNMQDMQNMQNLQNI